MKQYILLIALVFSIFGSFSYSQELKTKGFINAELFSPEEIIYMHTNASLLFSGEYLYYNVSCLDNTNTSFSRLSKVAYVEMINEEKERVFRHKIKLDKGIGYSEYFIPTSISTGNYKLIAYTQWMKNGGKEYFFQEDVTIINPYLVDQSVTANSSEVEANNTKNTFSFEALEIKKSNWLQAQVNGTKFKKRSQVSLTLKNLKNPIFKGNYSISIRNIDTINYPKKHTAVNFKESYKKDKNTEIIYPELNGGIIAGRVIDSETKLPAKNIIVALSISGDGFVFKVDTTDENGGFDISVNKEYEPNVGILQVLNEEKERYFIEYFETPSVNVTHLEIKKLKLSSALKNLILERSINNQIENAYYSVKPDRIRSITQRNPFYKDYNTTTYVLDEHTHFPTVAETFLEVVEHAGSTKNDKKEKVFFVRSLEDNEKTYLPLIFIDGILIQNHDDLYNMNVRRIDKISVLRGQVNVEGSIYQGILIIDTKDKNYKNKEQGDFVQEIALFKPQLRKDYYKQIYTEVHKNISDRVPDFRTQLLWEPNVALSSEEKTITFYTSDITGVFEVVLEGFTEKLEPVSIKNYFIVEE